mgnify:CR=1 FL=1
MEKFNCKSANQIDLVNYLETLGHEPSKIKNQDINHVIYFEIQFSSSQCDAHLCSVKTLEK